MDFEQFLKNEKLKRKIKNFDLCIKEAKKFKKNKNQDNDLVYKINNRLESNSEIILSVDELINFISNYETLKGNEKKLVSFIINEMEKDPLRQNICETIVLDHLRNTKGLKNVQKPVKPDLYLSNGCILERQGRKKTGETKSVDVLFEIDDYKFLGTIKYTKDEGGAQDNQIADVVDFLRNSIGLKGYIPVAIVDGKYYTEERMDALKSINENSEIFHVLDIEKIIDKYKK